MTETIKNSMLCPVSVAEIHQAMNGECFSMRLVGDDCQAIQTAVNQGIDSRLEVCYVRERGDSYEWEGGRLACEVSPESMPTLLRRLFDDDTEEMAGFSLAESILSCLGFDDSGRFVGREALGLD